MSSKVYVKPPAEPGKKKKWSLGNLFRRKARRSGSTSSDSSSSERDREERKKGGFLARRKKRNDRGSKDVTDSFTVIAPQPPSGALLPQVVAKVSGSSGGPPPAPKGTPESARSGSLTSLEGRRRTKAKVEASRELLGGTSSSGEEDDKPQLPHLEQTCGSWPHSKRTRAARTERYIRRLSKETLEGTDPTVWRKWRPLAHSASTSPAHSPGPRRGQRQYNFRSASYDGNLPTGVRQSPTPPPPPPPPRRYDPPRPMSYAFEADAPDPTRSPGGSLGRIRNTYRAASEQQIPGPRPQYHFQNHHCPLSHQLAPSSSPPDRRKVPLQHPIPAPRTSLKLCAPTPPHPKRTVNNSMVVHDALVRPFQYNTPDNPPPSENRVERSRLPLVRVDNKVRNTGNMINNNSYIHPTRKIAEVPPNSTNHSGERRHHICEPNSVNGSINRGQSQRQQQVNRIKPTYDASAFWRQQDMKAARSLGLIPNGGTPERSTSTSPRPQDSLPRVSHRRSDSGGSTRSEGSSTVSSLPRRKEEDFRPLSIVVEKSEHSDLESAAKLKPPAPPERKSSRQSSVSSNTDFEKRSSGNLEDALQELEAIYRTLKMGEEEAVAEAANKSTFRGTESDTGFHYDPDRNKEARMTDDMAYRRLNKKEPNSFQDARELVSRAGSYLLVSPTLSPPSLFSYIQASGKEPDITKDDVVYRSITHTNNTLKISDPQPPFGIPLGPVAPAAESDYLHATPCSTPVQGSSPDIVTDDLAFRNLRKDSTQENTLSLKKKKAVRSLSANLSGYIRRDSASGYHTSSSTLSGQEVNNNNLSSTESLKPPKETVSRLGVAEGLRLAHRMLDIRRKALHKNDAEEVKTSPRAIESQASTERTTTPTNEELRRKFFSDAYRDLETSEESRVMRQLEDRTETELLRQLEDEARATSRQIGILQLQHQEDTKSVAQLLKELTKSLDQDFGKPCQACEGTERSRVDEQSVGQCSDQVPPLESADSGVLLS